MKLLSMWARGENNAGVVIGDNVVDVPTFFSLIGKEPGLEFEDALDLYNYGGEAIQTAIISPLEGDQQLAAECQRAGVLRPISEVTLNPPVLSPGKIFGVGLNYAAHAAEQNAKTPDSPLIFSKCTTALIGPGDSIRLPRISSQIDYEAELAVIIGKEAKSVSASSAINHIAGYAIMNDVTARDLQRRERQWPRAKGLDTFAPCGPWLVTTDEITDPHRLAIQLRLNGVVRQSSNTNDLIFKIPELIEFISEDLTLLPGDIITTGTPSGVGVYMNPPSFLKAGDEVEITIDRIGTLRNTVIGPEA